MEAAGLFATPEAGAVSADPTLARHHSRSRGDPCSGFRDRLTDEVERAADEHDAIASGTLPRATERLGGRFRDFRFTRELLCEVTGRGRAVPANAGEDHRSADAADQREHRREVFVTHRPEDDHERTALRQLLNRVERPLQPSGVVRAVDQHDWISIDDLEPAGPAGPRQTVA